MRIPHRAPFSSSLRALSVVAGTASEWRVVLIVRIEKKKEAKTPRNPFPGQHGVRLAEGDPRYDLERARFESPGHPLHTKLTRVFGAGEENADALTLHLIGSSARLTCRPLRDLYYS